MLGLALAAPPLTLALLRHWPRLMRSVALAACGLPFFFPPSEPLHPPLASDHLEPEGEVGVPRDRLDVPVRLSKRPVRRRFDEDLPEGRGELPQATCPLRGTPEVRGAGVLGWSDERAVSDFPDLPFGVDDHSHQQRRVLRRAGN